MNPSRLTILPAFLLAMLAPSCGGRSSTSVKDILPQYELTDKNDTINYMDVNALRQGHWIIYQVSNLTIAHTADSTDCSGSWEGCDGRRKIEEGYYKNDKKIGLWKRFAPDGSVKDSLEYKS